MKKPDNDYVIPEPFDCAHCAKHVEPKSYNDVWHAKTGQCCSHSCQLRENFPEKYEVETVTDQERAALEGVEIEGAE